jgi:hypothetical protein
MDEEKFISDEARPIAVKRLERSLIMDELARVEKIEVDRDLLQSSFEQTMGEYSGDARFQKTMRGKSQPPKQLMNAVAMESANRAYIQQTLNRLKEIANGQAPTLPDKKEKTAVKGKASSKSGKKTISEKKVPAAGALPRKSVKNDKKTARSSSTVAKVVTAQKKSTAKQVKKTVSKA